MKKTFWRTSVVVGLVALSITISTTANADQLFFDRSAFLGAIAGEVVIDFESDPVGPVVGDPWLALGIVFDEAGVGDNMAIGDGGGADMNIYALGGQYADIDITFPPSPVIAFGLGIFSNQTQDPGERVVFRGVGGSILVDVEMPVTEPGTSEFIGYIADDPIALVQFVESDTDGDYVGIGDVAFVVPEPATAWLLALYGLAVTRRHR